MSKIVKNGNIYCESVVVKQLPASDITYNNHNGLTKTNTQEAIDELASMVNGLKITGDSIDDINKKIEDFQESIKDIDAVTNTATQTTNGLMSSIDKRKLDGVDNNANNYSHPKYTQKSNGLYKVTVDNTGHVSGATLVTKQDILDLGISDSSSGGNSEYTEATQYASGLMSASDKTKLDNIANNANNYIHPSYTNKSSGLYKVTVDNTGHVSGATAVTKQDILDLGISEPTTYNNATQSTNGLMSSTDKTKLDNIATNANNYTHPAYTKKDSGMYKITVDDKGHVSGATAVTKQDILNLGISETESNSYNEATQSTSGLMSASDKTKLDNIATNANNYTHPSYTQKGSGLYKIAVDNTGHVSGTTAVTKQDILDLGISDNPSSGNTEYSEATQSVSGLMSANDKKKLDNIDDNANNYTHPSYTNKTSGMYKITVDNTGHVSATTAITKQDILNLGISESGSNSYDEATQSASGLMSASDKTKLDNIAENANNYTHPSYTQKASGLYKVSVDNTGHVSGTTAVTKQDILDLGISESGGGGSYDDATQSASGLMSADDKKKLDGIIDLIYPVGAIYISATQVSPATLFGGTWEEITGKFLLSRDSSHSVGSTGGSEYVTLTESQMPSHTHSGPNHDHSIGSHTHDLGSHTHDLGSHTHSGPSHSHTITVNASGAPATANAGSHTHKASYDTLTYVKSVTGGTTGTFTHYYPTGGTESSKAFTSSAGSHDHDLTDHSHSASSSTESGTTGAASGNTGAASGNTGSSSGRTGYSGTGETGSAGSGNSHNNMPPYLTVYMWKRTA